MVIANVTVGIGPSSLAVNSKTNLVYVPNSGSGSVSVINGTINKVIANVTVGGIPDGIVLNPTDKPKTNLVYVNLSGSIAVINGTSNKVIGSPIPKGSASGGIGFNPTTNLLYAVGGYGPLVNVINGTFPYKVIANFTVGFLPYSIGVNPTTSRIYVASIGNGNDYYDAVAVIDGKTFPYNTVLTAVPVGRTGISEFGAVAGARGAGSISVNPTTNTVYVPNAIDATVSVIGQREEIRDPCLQAVTPACLAVSSTGTLFPGTPQSTPVSLVAVSLRSNATKIGAQMALTVVCDYMTTDPNRQCSASYVDGNVWGPGQTDLSKSPFIIQNAEPYFYLQFHWWDFINSRIVAWGTWWYGTASNPNWYWGVYWWWRTYVNYDMNVGPFGTPLWIPWWWWVWHWTYWRYWAWWGTAFQT
jgi:YVTN family beta-propeller protein